MDLWIRSQDKNILLKVNSLCIEDEKILYANGIKIGKYDTKERALDVLDEMQYILRTCNNTMVYNMPEF